MKLWIGLELRSVFVAALLLQVSLSSHALGISSSKHAIKGIAQNNQALQAVSRGVQQNLPTHDSREFSSELIKKITWFDGKTTALHRSIDLHDLNMMKFILDHGSEVFYRVEDGSFRHIYEYPVYEYSRQLGQWAETRTEPIWLELEQPSWVNIFDSKGRLPLTIAAGIENREDSTEMISLLLEHDAEVNVLAKTSYPQNSHWFANDSASPLAHAVAALNVAGAKMLLDKDADPNLFDIGRIGSAPLYVALMQFDSEEGKEIVNLLRQYGADLNLADNKMGGSIFDKMLVYGAPPAAVRFMVQNDVDVNRTDKYGDTVLRSIVLSHSKRSRKHLNILLQVPAIDLDIRNTRGETALMVAAKFGNLRAVKKLVRNGAATHFRNKDGHSARDLAEQRLAHAEKSGYTNYLDDYRKMVRILEE